MRARWYQEEGVNAFFEYVKKMYQAGAQYIAPLLLYPTGTGKSVVLALIVQRLFKSWPRCRVVMSTHVKELVEQNGHKLRKVWPHAPLGIVSAGLKRLELGRAITYAGIATIYRIADQLGHVDVFFVDEAHLVNPKEETMYATVIAILRKRNPKLVVCGLTATGWRTKGGRLEENENAIFTGVAYDCTTYEMWERLLDDGFVAPLIVQPTDVELIYDKVQVNNTGDFNLQQLQAAVDDFATTKAAITELLYKAQGRQSGLIFAAGIEHAEHITNELRNRGERAVCIHSKMTASRDEQILAWKNGQFRWAVNNGVLTTGIDHPALDVIGGFRPTKSSALHGQMLGRGTRPFDGIDPETGREHEVFSPKADCLVLDFARNTRRLGPINDLKVPGDNKSNKRPDKAGMAVCRLCPDCDTYCPARAKECHKCGYVFPESEPAIEETAGTDEAMTVGKGRKKKEEEPNETAYFDVDRVTYDHSHGRNGKPDYLTVTYYCGLRRITEGVYLEHDGGARARAFKWWRERSDDPFVPNGVRDAVERVGELRVPSRIYVWVNRKPQPQVLSYVFQ